ncbi:MAG TPA: tetratricopeptide repeat protein [Acetobacteraceae bacterium]
MEKIRQLLLAMFALAALADLASADTLTADAAFSGGDYAAAYREWSQAAAGGDASAMAAVGTLYDTGYGVPQDNALALAWYRRAAEAGSVRGMFNTGAMYDNGRGTPANRIEALRWYARAAERGYGRAAFNAGLIYRDGDSVPRDRARAIRYFRIAEEDGILAARTNLVALHAIEPPGPPPARPAPQRLPVRSTSRASPPPPSLDADGAMAVRLQRAVLRRGPLDPGAVQELSGLVPALEAKAGKGSQVAQYAVGYAFENGYGVARDSVRSYVNYLQAAASSDGTLKAAALRGAADVGKTLTDVQHAAARDMLLDGVPGPSQAQAAGRRVRTGARTP